MNNGSGINPAVLKFVVALLIVGVFISFLEQSSKGAAALLAFVVVLLLFIKDSPLPGWLYLGSSALQKGIE